MPLITEDEANGGTPVLPAPVAPAPPETPKPAPSMLETTAAAFRQSNIISSVFDRAANTSGAAPAPNPNYDPYANNGEDIKGFEDYATRFTAAESPEQVQEIKNRISSELSDKETLARAGAWGYAATMAAGAIDPISLTMMFIPGLGEAAAASRIARVAATNIAAGEAQSGALALNSETTDYTEGVIPRVGINALLGGVLGGLATRIPRAELDALAERTAERMSVGPNAPESSTAGAAAVHTTSLEDEAIAKGGQKLSEWIGKVSPSTRIFSDSKVPEARRLAQQLVDPGILLEKNFKGEATLPSVEMRVNQQENVRNAQLFQKFDREFADYKQEGGELSKMEFSAEVADAMRNSDAHDIPQVKNVANFARPMFQGDRKILAEMGAMKEGEEVTGAPSYFPRVYDQPMIAAHRTDIEQRLYDWFKSTPKTEELKEGETGPPKSIYRDPTEIKAAVYDTLNHIQGTTRGVADIGQGVSHPAILKGRALDIPDSILKPYLSHDFEHVMMSYNHAVLPQIEMRRTFGTPDLTDQFREVTDAYHRQIEAAGTDDVKKKALNDQHSEDLRNLTLLRDRVMNQTGPKGNESLAIVRAAQLIRSFNYLRTLGGQTLSAIPDFGRLVGRYGLINTGHRTAQLLSGLSEGLARADAQRMGTALDVVLHTRQHTLDGVGDELAGSQLGQRMKNATATYTKLTLVATWDANMRVLSSQLEQDAIYRAITKENISAIERAKLASHGIGDAELPAIREQWLKHGSDELGLNRARTELWTDKAAAERVEGAVQRAASSTAFFVGKGDLPAFANHQLGKMLVQFKAFAISSVNRMTIPLAQGVAHGDIKAVNGIASLLALGALSYYVKELAAGRKPDLEPGQLMANAVQRSGLLTYVPDLYDPLAGTFHLPRFAKFQDLNPLETLAGPSFGTGATLLEMTRRITKGDLNAGDIHKIRQMLPYQNLFYFNRLINMLEGKTADAFGVKDAQDRPAVDYLNPAKDPESKGHADKAHLFGQDDIPNAF